jgi:hypothetical protein
MQKFILKINQIYIFTALPKNIELYEPIWNITLVFLFPIYNRSDKKLKLKISCSTTHSYQVFQSI